MNSIYVTAGGYVASALLFFLLLNAREDLGAVREECETAKVAAIAEAERVTREATQRGLQRRLNELAVQARVEREATALANMARNDALAEANEAQETIRRLMREASNNETATISQVCLNTDIDPAALDGLR